MIKKILLITLIGMSVLEAIELQQKNKTGTSKSTETNVKLISASKGYIQSVTGLGVAIASPDYVSLQTGEKDWVGVYAVGASTAWRNVKAWAWVKDFESPAPGDGVTEWKSYHFKDLPTNKSYEIRYFKNNSYTTYKKVIFKRNGSEKDDVIVLKEAKQHCLNKHGYSSTILCKGDNVFLIKDRRINREFYETQFYQVYLKESSVEVIKVEKTKINADKTYKKFIFIDAYPHTKFFWIKDSSSVKGKTYGRFNLFYGDLNHEILISGTHDSIRGSTIYTKIYDNTKLEVKQLFPRGFEKIASVRYTYDISNPLHPDLLDRDVKYKGEEGGEEGNSVILQNVKTACAKGDNKNRTLLCKRDGDNAFLINTEFRPDKATDRVQFYHISFKNSSVKLDNEREMPRGPTYYTTYTIIDAYPHSKFFWTKAEREDNPERMGDFQLYYGDFSHPLPIKGHFFSRHGEVLATIFTKMYDNNTKLEYTQIEKVWQDNVNVEKRTIYTYDITNPLKPKLISKMTKVPNIK